MNEGVESGLKAGNGAVLIEEIIARGSHAVPGFGLVRARLTGSEILHRLGCIQNAARVHAADDRADFWICREGLSESDDRDEQKASENQPTAEEDAFHRLDLLQENLRFGPWYGQHEKLPHSGQPVGFALPRVRVQARSGASDHSKCNGLQSECE